MTTSENRVAVVTGAAQGFGREISIGLAESGVDVVAVDLNEAKDAVKAIESAGARGVSLVADVADPTVTTALSELLNEEFGRADILVNNAGIYPNVAFDDVDYQLWNKVMTINLDSQFFMVKGVLPLMKKGGWGRIVNITSNSIGLPVTVDDMAVPADIDGDHRGEQHSPAAVQGVGPVVAPLRVVVADDDVLFREGLASLLDRSGIDVVGQAGDGAQLLELVRDTKPVLVVTDIRMPPTNTTEGLDAAQVIRDEFPDTAILVLSAHVDVEQAMELLASGHAIGYLLKSRVTDVADFIDTLERIANGASVIDPALVQELVSARRRHDPLAVLSTREHEVLAQMAEGLSNAGIAHRIWVTEGTVEKHVRSILTKLDLPESDDENRRVLAVIMFLDAP
jgi:DNA-binding NarL/FixJ family response regulator